MQCRRNRGYGKVYEGNAKIREGHAKIREVFVKQRYEELSGKYLKYIKKNNCIYISSQTSVRILLQEDNLFSNLIYV